MEMNHCVEVQCGPHRPKGCGVQCSWELSILRRWMTDPIKYHPSQMCVTLSQVQPCGPESSYAMRI